MNLIVLTALILMLLPYAASTQTLPVSSVCTGPDNGSSGAILTICTHERGMAPRPQPRLYLRLFADGRAEYEINAEGTSQRLEKKEVRVTPAERHEILCLGREPDFQAADASYPAVHLGIDSSRETTVTFRDGGKNKKIVVRNYWAGAYDNVEHYPSSFNALMDRAHRIWGRAMGIVYPIPSISFCEMIENREAYLGRLVSIYAVIEHQVVTTRDGKHSVTNEYLYDTECPPETKKASMPVRESGVSYAGEKGTAEALKSKIAAISEKPFYGRARVHLTGTLRDDTLRGPVGLYAYNFEITEIKSIDPVILPYQGVLENGWTYSDTFDHEGGRRIELSTPVRAERHHAAQIEWTNAHRFPSLLKPGQKGITFRVTSVTTHQIEKSRWNTTYNCEILELKRVK